MTVNNFRRGVEVNYSIRNESADRKIIATKSVNCQSRRMQLYDTSKQLQLHRYSLVSYSRCVELSRFLLYTQYVSRDKTSKQLTQNTEYPPPYPGNVLHRYFLKIYFRVCPSPESSDRGTVYTYEIIVLYLFHVDDIFQGDKLKLAHNRTTVSSIMQLQCPSV